ncbi:glycosyl transferase [Pseudovibrio japonicus]|uniref:Glycosyl transferase n=1 Tax=Pseudovibrio japonicus TaxID=366534 RepID=A0ABQ3E831_9HYPH|nr:glycosyltransferase family 8 protein [Pseudovibrio japonicus]GHB26346.1 glycosyl transferase [Pseudovibrio japonicus]
MQQETSIPIVFAFDDGFALPGSIAIASLVQAAKTITRYDIYVLHDGLPKDTRDKLAQIVEGTAHQLTFHHLDQDVIRDAPTSKNWPAIVYARLFIPKMFPQFDKVIYSDVDVLFKCDLTALFNEDLEGYHIAAVPAETMGQAFRLHQRLDGYQNKSIFMSGLIIFNTPAILADDLCDKMGALANQYGDQLKMFDLELMNLAFSKIKPIAIDYCVLEWLLSETPTSAAEWQMLVQTHGEEALECAIQAPKIVHYAGHLIKVWDRTEQPEDYLRYVKRSPFAFRWKQVAARKAEVQRHLWFYTLLSKVHPLRRKRHDLRGVLKQIRVDQQAKAWATRKLGGSSLS